MADAFIDQLSSSRLSRSRPNEQCGPFLVHWADLRPLKLGIGPYVPFLRWATPDAGAPDVVEASLVKFSREQAHNAPTVFLSADEEPVDALNLNTLKHHSVAVVPAALRSAFVAARDHERRYQILGSALAHGIGAGALSPYLPGKPASGGRFFGRSKVLEQIITGKVVQNCTIVGNRRIGKTSVLHETKERLLDLFVVNKNIHFAEVYASKPKSTWDFVYLILSQLGIQVPKSWTKFGAIAPRYIKRFPQLVQDFARRTRTQVVILIDEFDAFLEIDETQGWELLHLLRETAAEGEACAVVIAGFRKLMQMRVRQDTPYYNFTHEIVLMPLTKEETLDMVQIPLGRLGINVADTSIPAFVHRETRGRPEIIQMYCRAIIALYERRCTVPTDGEIAQHINRDPAFNRTILHTFLHNANAIEQALCFHLMKKAIASGSGVAQYEFRIAEAEEGLAAHGLTLSNAETATLLHNLVVGSFIDRITGAPGLYRFAVPQLVRFCQSVGLEGLLANATSQFAGTSSNIRAITFEPPEV